MGFLAAVAAACRLLLLMLLLLLFLFVVLLLPVCCLDLGYFCVMFFGRVSAVPYCTRLPAAPLKHSQQSEFPAATPLRTKRSARRHCARGLVAPLTRPALAVHFNCRQPRHSVSEIDQLINPAPPHSAAYPAPCALVSPPPHAARFIPPRARSGVRWCACLHALLRCFLLARYARLVRAAANAGWRAITGTTGRRAPSAS